MMKLVALVMAFGLAQAALPQAPAGAPAGSNGICKDGTYSTAASKDGACRGHKGVQTWYAASAAKPSAASSKATAAPATPVATKTAPVSMAPAPAAAKAMPAAATKPVTASPASVASAPASPAAAPAAAPKRSGPAAAAAAKAQAPGGGPGMVWVNTASNVYHCPGTDYYGKTKAGSYMSEADAKAKGARADRGKACGQ